MPKPLGNDTEPSLAPGQGRVPFLTFAWSRMTSPYRNFKDLASREVEGRDYRIRIARRNSHVLVMAPHGGKIEPTTSEIAQAIAGKNYSLYCFEGLKQEGNGKLHMESHLFDEPQATNAAEKAEIVVTVHGQIDQNDAFVMVGGLLYELDSEIEHQLKNTGFQTRPPTEGLTGTDPMNICNRGKVKRGVQLEISRKLRDLLRDDPDRLKTFSGAIQKAIQKALLEGKELEP